MTRTPDRPWGSNVSPTGGRANWGETSPPGPGGGRGVDPSSWSHVSDPVVMAVLRCGRYSSSNRRIGPTVSGEGSANRQ